MGESKSRVDATVPVAVSKALDAVHVGRSWVGHPLEDDCLCAKAPCGLVDQTRVHPDCPQHTLGAAKTMRQMHFAEDCPALTTEPAPQATPSTASNSEKDHGSGGGCG